MELQEAIWASSALEPRGDLPEEEQLRLGTLASTTWQHMPANNTSAPLKEDPMEVVQASAAMLGGSLILSESGQGQSRLPGLLFPTCSPFSAAFSG